MLYISFTMFAARGSQFLISGPGGVGDLMAKV